MISTSYLIHILSFLKTFLAIHGDRWCTVFHIQHPTQIPCITSILDSTYADLLLE